MSLASIYYLHEIGGKKNQEDYIWPVGGNASERNTVFIVCDGVGGSANGEVASKIVAETIGNLLVRGNENDLSPAYVDKLLQEAKKRLVDYAGSNALNSDMATTLSLLVLLPGKAFIAWCGDSRVYHIRNGEILFKTEDHSLVMSLVKKGELSEAEAKTHPRSNVILKAIMADNSEIEADYRWTEQVIDGDNFLLCTDGLLENISDDDLSYLSRPENISEPDILNYIQQKCKDKTRDNYSMYWLKVKADPVNNKSGKKTNRSTAILLMLILIGFFSVAFFIKRNKMVGSPSVVKDSTFEQQQNGSKSFNEKNLIPKHKVDSFPEIEVISEPDNELPSQKDSSLYHPRQ